MAAGVAIFPIARAVPPTSGIRAADGDRLGGARIAATSGHQVCD